jgi:hypothetical protein
MGTRRHSSACGESATGHQDDRPAVASDETALLGAGLDHVVRCDAWGWSVIVCHAMRSS